MDSSQVEPRIQTICLLLLSSVAGGAALYWLSPVLVPFVLAIFFTYCLTPVIDLQMQYLRAPRPVAIVATFALGCVVLTLLAVLVSTSVTQISANADMYQTRITQLTDEAITALPLERFGVQKERVTQTLLQIPEQFIGGVLSGAVSAIMNVLSNGLLVLIFMLFLLLGKSAASQANNGGLQSEIETRIKKFILTKSLVSIVTGVLVGTTLTLLGVEFAFVFGVLAFLLNFIPNIGSAIATLMPLPVVLLNPELTTVAKVLAIAIPGVIQFAVGNFVEPKIMGQSLDLHPVAVLISLIFFGMIWGIVGMFLATPITAVVKIFFERVPFTRPAADLLAGRLDAIPAYAADHKPAS
jgi:AI-2 transport protein TqsA